MYNFIMSYAKINLKKLRISNMNYATYINGSYKIYIKNAQIMNFIYSILINLTDDSQ